jgi:hypothetical protein
MIDHKHMAASSDPARTLREPKARLSGIGQELDEGQTLLPERQRSTGIDDDIAEAVVSLDMAENSIDAVLRQLAKVTGEELSAAKSVLTNTMATLADADEDARRAQQGVEAALTPLFIAEADRVIARPQVCTRTFIENTKSCFGSVATIRIGGIAKGYGRPAAAYAARRQSSGLPNAGGLGRRARSAAGRRGG